MWAREDYLRGPKLLITSVEVMSSLRLSSSRTAAWLYCKAAKRNTQQLADSLLYIAILSNSGLNQFLLKMCVILTKLEEANTRLCGIHCFFCSSSSMLSSLLPLTLIYQPCAETSTDLSAGVIVRWDARAIYEMPLYDRSQRKNDVLMNAIN